MTITQVAGGGQHEALVVGGRYAPFIGARHRSVRRGRRARNSVR